MLEGILWLFLGLILLALANWQKDSDTRKTERHNKNVLKQAEKINPHLFTDEELAEKTKDFDWEDKTVQDLVDYYGDFFKRYSFQYSDKSFSDSQLEDFNAINIPLWIRQCRIKEVNYVSQQKRRDWAVNFAKQCGKNPIVAEKEVLLSGLSVGIILDCSYYDLHPYAK